MSGLISVIVPVHNGEAFLSDCLESLVRQTWRQLEILVIDDGSTDGSAALCRRWQEKDGRIRFFQKENGGVSSARNLGLEMARGEYAAFVDADDWLLPGMLYKLPPKPEKPNALELTSAERRARLADTDREKPADKRLMEAFSGLSPLIARELAHRAERGDLAMVTDAWAESVQAGELYPYLLCEDGQARDFTYMRVTQYGERMSCEPRGSFNELLEEFYAERERAERMRRVSHELTTTVRTIRDRQSRKLVQQRAELDKTADREKYKRRGDLITANLWKAA